MATEAAVPELPGYVWLGGPDPFDLRSGGRYVGCEPGTLGYCVDVRSGCASGCYVAGRRITFPDGGVDQWHNVMRDARLPTGGLVRGTPAVLVWDALAGKGYLDIEQYVDITRAWGDVEALAAAVRRVARQVDPDAVVPAFPDEIIKTYRILI